MEQYHNDRGQLVGELTNGIYRKIVQKSKHLFKKYHAWGIDSNIIEDLQGKCDQIRIKESESGKIYWVEFEKFYDKGIRDDYGFRKQVFLPLAEFTIEEEQRES